MDTTASTIALKAQVDVLTAVMQEVCRTLLPEQAQAVTAGVRARLAAGQVENEAADEAQAEVLAPLLAALRQ